jgi:hypothetical protein
MVNMPYFEHIPFVAKPNGVVMVHSILTGHVRKTLDSLDKNGKYICICREADDPFDELSLVKEFENVKYWFVTNCEIKHPKVEAIPFGYSFGSTTRTEGHTELISSILRTDKTIINEVFGCCSINPDRPEIVANRAPARDAIKDKPWAKWCVRLGADEYLENFYHHNFMISPAGGGIDCVRTWETLYLKSIPIVKNHIVYEHFNDMPIAYINNWSEINPSWCDAQKEQLKNKSTDRLDMQYWIDRINEMNRRYL